MENQIYRLDATDNHTVEFYVCATNETEPYRSIREMALTVTKKNIQIDASLNDDELESLIQYLKDCQQYIKEYNKK